MNKSAQQSIARSGPSLFLSAGEISGDLQAAHLAGALLRANPRATLYGCGGERMQASGVDVRVRTAHLGYVGIEESVPMRNPIRHAHARLSEILRDDPPDLAVLVDGERFNIPLIRQLRRLEIPFVYYFVPLVWFWGRWRARHIARHARLILPAFPAEREIFQKRGARVEWLGHPLLDIVHPVEDSDALLLSAGLDPARPIVGLMPGSRAQEVESFSPTLLRAARQLRDQRPGLQFVLPVAAPHLLPELEAAAAAAGLSGSVRFVSANHYTLLSRCEVVLVASGTATLEVALLGVPMVVFYRVHPATYLAARALLSTRFISLPNILLGHEVVPELIQGRFTADQLVEKASAILDSPERARAIRSQLALIPPLLGGGGVVDRAAALILRETVPAAERGLIVGHEVAAAAS